VDRGHDAVDLETLSLRHVEGAVLEYLDLEPLVQAMIVAVLVVPALDAPPLEAKPFLIKTGSDFQTTRVVGDHRPGISAPDTRTGHGLERRLAVGVSAMPVAGATQAPRVEIRRTGVECLGHLGAAQVSAAVVASVWGLAALESLHRGLERILTSACHELLNQWLKPLRRTLQQVAMGIAMAVKCGVAGTQQCQPPVSRRLAIGERE
jgi:hypothetical protein